MFIPTMIIRSFWKVILWIIVITVLSCLPAQDIIKPPYLNIPNLDKIVHFLMYSFFSFLLLQGLLRYKPAGNHELFLIIAVITSSVYGCLMELAQLKIFTSREGDIIDLVYNIAGVMAGLLIYELFCQSEKRA
jgi:glycopeptide antibiotics resistance protein